MTRDELAELIDRTVKAVGNYLSWRDLAALSLSNLALSKPPRPDLLASYQEAHNRQMDHKVEVRLAVRELAPELERWGEDSTGLLRLLYLIDGGGGPDHAPALWGEVQPALQRTAIQLRLGLRDASPAPGMVPGRKADNGRPRRQPGRPPKYDPKKDARIADAVSGGTPLKEIARSEGMTLPEAGRAVGRERKRRKRAAKRGAAE